ncbi:Transcriptional regulator, MarR family [Acetobacter malorum]|nr:Transcriptional regulator, MarR family [Acetobacter malorum]
MEPPRYPDNSIETRRSFGHRLARLAAIWRREIDADLRRFSLTDATWRPIYYLNFSEQPVRQTDLARSLSLEAPSLVRLLDVLEKRGFIVREIDEEDRRSKLVSIYGRRPENCCTCQPCGRQCGNAPDRTCNPAGTGAVLRDS